MNTLLGSLPDRYQHSYLRFSALTNARNVQNFLEQPLEKVKGSQYAPKYHKRHIYYVEDVNTTKKEVYGAIPPMEVLRELLEHQSWYELSNNSRKSASKVSFLCSMDIKKGCKHGITARFKRQFHTIAIEEPSTETITDLFSTAAVSYFAKKNPIIKQFSKQLSESSVQMLEFAKSEFSAIEPKTLQFGTHDIMKVFEGIGRAKPLTLSSPKQLAELWVHEHLRVYQDRMNS